MTEKQREVLVDRLVKNESTTPGAGRKVRCNHCGDIIQSQHRHDYVRCSCRTIAVDGGSSYLRMAFQHPDDYTVLAEDNN